MKLRFSYLIFDFDGTLSDTGEGVLKSAKYALDSYSIPAPPWEELGFFVGPPLYDSFMMVPGVNHELALQLVDKYRERYREAVLNESVLYPGVAELLHELYQNGAVLAIASSKPTVFIDKLLEKFALSSLFTVVSGIGLTRQAQPTKAQLIDGALTACGCTDKSLALMVGDRKFDIEGAHAAGIQCAALEHGYGSREEFEEFHADVILRDTEALRKFLELSPR